MGAPDRASDRGAGNSKRTEIKVSRDGGRPRNELPPVDRSAAANRTHPQHAPAAETDGNGVHDIGVSARATEVSSSDREHPDLAVCPAGGDTVGDDVESFHWIDVEFVNSGGEMSYGVGRLQRLQLLNTDWCLSRQRRC